MKNQTGQVSWTFLLLLAVAAVVLSIALSSLVRARAISQQNACIGNMRVIDAGKEQAAMAARLSDGDTISTASINMYIKGSTNPICPSRGTYTYNRIGEAPACSVTEPRLHAASWGH